MTTKADRDSIREQAAFERVSRAWSKACVISLCDELDDKDARIAEWERVIELGLSVEAVKARADECG